MRRSVYVTAVILTLMSTLLTGGCATMDKYFGMVDMDSPTGETRMDTGKRVAVPAQIRDFQ